MIINLNTPGLVYVRMETGETPNLYRDKKGMLWIAVRGREGEQGYKKALNRQNFKIDNFRMTLNQKREDGTGGTWIIQEGRPASLRTGTGMEGTVFSNINMLPGRNNEDVRGIFFQEFMTTLVLRKVRRKSSYWAWLTNWQFWLILSTACWLFVIGLKVCNVVFSGDGPPQEVPYANYIHEPLTDPTTGKKIPRKEYVPLNSEKISEGVFGVHIKEDGSILLKDKFGNKVELPRTGECRIAGILGSLGGKIDGTGFVFYQKQGRWILSPKDQREITYNINYNLSGMLKWNTLSIDAPITLETDDGDEWIFVPSP